MDDNWGYPNFRKPPYCNIWFSRGKSTFHWDTMGLFNMNGGWEYVDYVQPLKAQKTPPHWANLWLVAPILQHHREEWSLDESAGDPGDVAHLRLHLPDARHATPKVDDFVWGNHNPKWESAWHGTLMIWCFFLRERNAEITDFFQWFWLIIIIQYVFDWWLCLSLFVFFEEVSVCLTCTLTLGFLCLDQILGPKTCMLHMFSSQPSNSHVLSVTSNVDPQPFYAVKSWRHPDSGMVKN